MLAVARATLASSQTYEDQVAIVSRA